MNDNEDVPLELPTAPCTTTTSTSNNVNKPRNSHDPNVSISKTKRFKKSNGEPSSSTASFKKTGNIVNDLSTSDDEHSNDDEHHICTKQPSSDQIPTFNGRTVTNTKKSNKPTNTTSSSEIQQLLSLTKKLETQYLKPMLVRLERLETMTQNSFSNQKKIQNILRKQNVMFYLLIVIRIFYFYFR